MGQKHASKRKGHFLLNSYKPDEINCIKLLLKLSDEALKYNSRSILLYGNHDIMELYKTLNNSHLVNIHEELNVLKEKILCNYHSFCIVNGYLFCHSGFDLNLIQLLLKMFDITEDQFNTLDVKDKIYLINVCVSSLLNGILSYQTKKDKIKESQKIILDIFEHRKYSKMRRIFDETFHDTYKIELTKNITETKELFKVLGMVIGHNQTLDYKIHIFDDLYDIDVKISEGFGSDIKNDINQILKIEKDNKPEIIEVNNK